MRYAVIYGSVREGRQGIKLAKFFVNKLEERGHEVTLIDPKKYELPLLNKRYKDFKEGEAPEVMEELHNMLTSAEGYFIVTGEYNHSMPPALKNLLDHFMPEYFWKPSGIVSYSVGGFGGVRAAMNARVVLGELGMVSIPSTFPVSKVHESFDDEGKDLTGRYEQNVKRFLDEFEWYAEALANHDGNKPY